MTPTRDQVRAVIDAALPASRPTLVPDVDAATDAVMALLTDTAPEVLWTGDAGDLCSVDGANPVNGTPGVAVAIVPATPVVAGEPESTPAAPPDADPGELAASLAWSEMVDARRDTAESTPAAEPRCPYETRIEQDSFGHHVAWVVDGPTLAVGDRAECDAAVEAYRKRSAPESGAEA